MLIWFALECTEVLWHFVEGCCEFLQCSCFSFSANNYSRLKSHMDGAHPQQHITHQACFDQTWFPSSESTFSILPLGKTRLVPTTPHPGSKRLRGQISPTQRVSSSPELVKLIGNLWRAFQSGRLELRVWGVFVSEFISPGILFTRNAGELHGMVIKASMVWGSVLPAVWECVCVCDAGEVSEHWLSAVCLQKYTRELRSSPSEVETLQLSGT